MRIADIQVNVDVKQFKSGARLDNGVVPGEELHGEFQKIPAKPIVVLQKLDGSLEVVTGRHRLDLARRNGLETIPANIIKEADGWTPESAALLDAFDNILDEKGSYADYVPFFRKAGISREVAEAYGLLARPKGRLSFEIAMNGTDDLVSFVAAGDKRVTPDVAAAICRAVPVPAAAREAGALTGQAARYDAIQHYVIRAVIDEGLRADQAEIMANGIRAEYAKRAEANTIQQDDLFGADETFNTEMALRAKYAGDQLAKINLDLRALKIVSGKQSGNVAAKDSLLKKYNIKGPDDSAGIERAIQELETLHHRWQHYYTDPELAHEADAFVKKSLRLDPEDQPPVVIVQPDASDSRFTIHDSPAGQSPASPEPAPAPAAEPAPQAAADIVAGDRASIVRNIQAERATPYAGHIWRGPAGEEIPSAGGERITIPDKGFLPLMGRTLERTSLAPETYPADAIVWEPLRLPHNDILIPNTVLGKRIERPASLSDKKIEAIVKAYVKANNAYADALQALGDRPATGAAKQKAWDKKMETLKATLEKQAKPYERLVEDLEAFAKPYGKSAVGHYVKNADGTFRIVGGRNGMIDGDYLQPDGSMLHILDRTTNVAVARTQNGKPIEVTHWTRPSHWESGQQIFENQLVLNTRYAIGADGRPAEVFIYGEDGRPTSHFSLRNGDPIDPRNPDRVHMGEMVDGYDGDGIYRNGQRVGTITLDELNAAPTAAEPATRSAADELPLGSPAAQPAAPNGARPETSAQTSVSTPEVARNERKQAESDAARKERQARRAAQRARMVTAEDLGVGGLTDEQGNGPDFMPVRPEESDSTIKGETLAKRKLKPDTNVRLGFDFHIDARDDALKIAKFTSSGEDGRAHRYAARNIIPLVKRAGVAVRQKNYNDTTDSRVSKEFERLFIPYFFEGRLYVAVVSQRYQDVRGVHALETLDVFRAETRPEVSSDESKGSERPTGGFHALNTITIPNEGPNDNTLSLASIQRVIDNPKKGGNQNPRLLDPDGNGGLTETPCTAQDVADRIRADIADFVGRARYRVDHTLQPIDADDVGRFTMGEGVTVEVADGVATVTGLAGKSPEQAAKLLDAIQTQLPPNVTISTDATPVARQGAPESPESPASPARTSGGNAAAPLANQAPGTQGSQAPAQTGRRQPAPNRPQSAESAVPPDVPNLQSAGADIVSAAVYPNGGRVPVAGSPAATAGTLPLSLPHAVQLFHLLTGKLPGIVAQKNRGPRNALGWFLPKTGDAFVRAQLFGLIDQSDLTVLKDGLAKRGYFRHEDPAWCVTQTKDSIRREKALSNQKLAKAADLLIRRRTRAGVHQGAAAKVMAHELWHAISASGGVPPRDHGNLLGQIYNLKKCMANALPENTFATDDVLRQEAKEFITWWRGVGQHEPYFDQPHEAYAEMGAAFFLAPEAVRERAPTYYDAMLDGLRNYPQAFDALAAIRDQRAAGGDLDAFQQRLQTTWQAAHEARIRKLRDEAGKPTEDERNMRLVQLLWNRHAPVMLILQRAQETVRARLRKDLKEGNITQADHDAKIKELDEELLDLRHHTLLFTHRHGNSKLFLADIWGTIAQRAEELGVTMNDLNLYLHLRRVEELKGRATALGVDPPTARAIANRFFKRLGYGKVRAIARLAKTFHAVWQRNILENPDVVAMLGPDKIAELKQNAHYITMRHVPTPEELEAATIAWEKTKRAKPGGDPLDPIVRELLGHQAYTSGIFGAKAKTGVASALKRLQGSFRQTESPLTATAETGVAILEAAQRNALAVSLFRALKAVGFDEIVTLKPNERVISNDRIGTFEYMENGQRVTLAAPRSVVDALSGAPHEIPYLTAATRFLSAGFTTNNPAFIIPAALRDLDSLYLQMPGMKRGFAQWCAAYANLIPGIGPLRYARAAVNLGNWVNWSAQFIPPHVMKRISQTPIGKLLYGQNTVAYWTSVGAKIARIIQHMDFEGTLRQAREARLAGDDAKAEALEYCATMARHALEDGVLLTYNQQLADDYLKGGLQRLFDKYHLKYDDDRRHIPIPAKIAKRAQDYRDTLRQRLLRANAIKDPKKRIAALAAIAASPLADLYRTTLWESAGFLSEYQSMMVKLAGWAYLHHESAAGTLPPLPADPAGNAAPQGATPVARQGAPFSVPRSPFSAAAQTPPPPVLRYQLVTDGVTIWPLDTVASKASVNAATNQVASVEASVADLAGLTETLGSRVNALEATLDDLAEDGVWALEGYVNSIGVLSGTPEYSGEIEILEVTTADNAADPAKTDLTLKLGEPGHHEGRSRPRRRLRGAHLHLLLPRHRGRARRDPPRLHLHHHLQHPQRILQGRLHRGRRRRRRRLPPRLRRPLRQRRQRTHCDGDRRRRHHPHLHRRSPRRGNARGG